MFVATEVCIPVASEVRLIWLWQSAMAGMTEGSVPLLLIVDQRGELITMRQEL